MLTKITKSLTVVAMALMFTACAGGSGVTRQAHVPLKDLDDFEVDCRQKTAQLDFLYRLLPGAMAYQKDSYNVMHSPTQSTIALLDGTYNERQYGAFNQAVVRRKIRYLETYCR